MSESKKVQQYKIDRVQRLKSQIEKTDKFLFADYRGLSVGEITSLRVELREMETEFHVVKNAVAKIAFRELKQDGVEHIFAGPTAMAYCYGDVGPAAKLMFKVAKKSSLEVKAGLVSGEIYDSGGVKALSELPGRLELIQMLMGTMQAPLVNLLHALDGVSTKLVRTLAAVAEEKSAAT